jgi:hypothetical protein
MKFLSLSLSLLALTTLSALVVLPIPHASAQCVESDINFQTSNNGSGKPTDRTNDVRQGSKGGCVGNSVSTTNVQSQTGGTERATQRRNSNQQINGGNNSSTGVNLEPVKIKTNVQIDTDNPADRLRRR